MEVRQRLFLILTLVHAFLLSFLVALSFTYSR